jgi:hypothetical protein
MKRITARRLIITMAVIQLIGIATLLVVSLQGMSSLRSQSEAGQTQPALRKLIVPLGIIAPLAFSFTIIPILVIAIKELPKSNSQGFGTAGQTA